MPVEKCPECNGTGEIATVKKGTIGGADIKRRDGKIIIEGGNTFAFGILSVTFIIGVVIGIFIGMAI